MAKKISALTYSIIIGMFVLTSLGSFLFEADEVTLSNSEKVGDNLLTLGQSGTSESRLTEVALQDNTFETGSFTLPEDRLVETRGISQGNIMSKDGPASVKKSLSNFGKEYNIGATEIAFLISLITVAGIVALIIIFRGDVA